MHRKALLAVAVLSLIAVAGCALTAVSPAPIMAVPPTGENIVVSPAEFNRDQLLSSVRSGMSATDVIAALGHPKGFDRGNWFYTYEYPHTPDCRERSWASILLISFKRGKVASAMWVPKG